MQTNIDAQALVLTRRNVLAGMLAAGVASAGMTDAAFASQTHTSTNGAV
jgi:hypothetical protein